MAVKTRSFQKVATATATAAFLTFSAAPAHAICWNLAKPWGNVSTGSVPGTYNFSALDWDAGLNRHEFVFVNRIGRRTYQFEKHTNLRDYRFTVPGNWAVQIRDIDQCGRYIGYPKTIWTLTVTR